METNAEKKELLNTAIDGLNRVLKMFSAERYVYLLLAIVSFVLTVYVAYLMIITETPNRETLIAVFGGSSVLTVASVRVTWFFGKAFNIFEQLIRRISK